MALKLSLGKRAQRFPFVGTPQASSSSICTLSIRWNLLWREIAVAGGSSQ
jgi:hypothetical protein